MFACHHASGPRGGGPAGRATFPRTPVWPGEFALALDHPAEALHDRSSGERSFMIFRPTPVRDAFIVELEKHGDERGFFARVYCEREFERAGLDARFVQVNNSLSARKGTLRGMHYQLAPHEESKLVRCIRGALFDVVLDLRPQSPTFGKWFGAELSADNRNMMFVPRGCAHGFLTLQDDTEAFYFAGDFYQPAAERGVRWDDPRFSIKWPGQPVVISERDRAWADYTG
jgi:dTDP-4-dehydrorhamnose 3,5-epimerase